MNRFIKYAISALSVILYALYILHQYFFFIYLVTKQRLKYSVRTSSFYRFQAYEGFYTRLVSLYSENER